MKGRELHVPSETRWQRNNDDDSNRTVVPEPPKQLKNHCNDCKVAYLNKRPPTAIYTV